MLKCVLGQLTPQAGSVAVFGMPPGASNDCVPGPGVGYMPQDTALDLELTVSELLYTYGTLSGLDSTEIAARSAALITLLELGAVDAVLPALCKNLSGGQARRVSLCCAMLHTPRLLLLDEPTVGVDPVLREKIWRTLVDLACGGTTVLITTHYIDEARQAGAVGFMRHGKIIAEGSPARLLEQYRVASLEDVFLRLCRPAAAADTADYASSVVLAHKPPPVGQVQAPTPPGAAAVLSVNRPPSLLRRSLGALGAWTATGVVGGGTRATAVNRRLPRWRMMAASAYRSLKRLQHNPGFVVFAFLLPALQVCLFCMAIGGDPYGLNFGVVNADVGGAMLGQPVNLGAELVAGLPASTFTLKTFDTVASARAAVLAGDAWGYLYVPGNYTTDLGLRFFDHPTPVEVINGSTVTIVLDMSDQEIAVVIEERVQTAFQDMLTKTLNKFGMGSMAAPFVQQGTPVYGQAHPRMTDFIAPGIMQNIAFGQSMGLTALALVIDKKRRVLERLLSTGITPLELMLGNFISQLGVLAVQAILMMVAALGFFHLPAVGSVWLAGFLILLQGVTGMTFGILVSCFCEEIETSLQVVLGVFFPIFLISGIIWPLEGMPQGMRYISQAFPTTWIAEGLRSVLVRGWGLSAPVVWRAISISFGWCAVMIAASVHAMRR